MATQNKFRPVLTLEQIHYIANLCSHALADKPLSSVMDPILSASIRKIMVPMIAKIDVGAITPAYSVSPEQAQKQKDNEDRRRYENDLMSPKEAQDYESKLLGDL